MPHIRWRSMVCRIFHFKQWKYRGAELIECADCGLWHAINEAGTK